jgi:putative endonuclease
MDFLSKFNVPRVTLSIMPKVFTSKAQKKGELGEDLAERFLISRGFRIVERNYTRRFGEIDIIAEKSERIHFFEVKSVSYETSKQSNSYIKNVTHETFIRPEENMHPKKLERLYRTIAVYLSYKGQKDWQLDLLCVYIDKDNKTAKVKLLENIVQ